VLRNPLPLAGIVVPYTLSVLPLSVQAVGPLVGTLRAAVAGLGLLLVLAVARVLRPEGRGPSWRSPISLSRCSIATAVQIVQWDRFLGGMPEPSSGALGDGRDLADGARPRQRRRRGALRDRARVREELLRVSVPTRCVRSRSRTMIGSRRSGSRHGCTVTCRGG
jgi:hypothetical protein